MKHWHILVDVGSGGGSWMCVAEMEISGISCIISHFMKYKSTIYSNYQIPNLECVCVLCEVQEGELSAVSGFANGIFCFTSSTSSVLGRATHNIFLSLGSHQHFLHPLALLHQGRPRLYRFVSWIISPTFVVKV